MKKDLTTDKDGTFSDGTAGVESVVWTVEAPVTRAYGIPKGAVVRAVLKYATPTDLPDGSILRIYATSPDGNNKKIILEKRYGAFRNANQYNKLEQITVDDPFIIPPAHKLIATVNSSSALKASNSSIEVVGVDEINMAVASEEVKKAIETFAKLLA
jgi:hypothetical protein